MKLKRNVLWMQIMTCLFDWIKMSIRFVKIWDMIGMRKKEIWLVVVHQTDLGECNISVSGTGQGACGSSRIKGKETMCLLLCFKAPVFLASQLKPIVNDSRVPDFDIGVVLLF